MGREIMTQIMLEIFKANKKDYNEKVMTAFSNIYRDNLESYVENYNDEYEVENAHKIQTDDLMPHEYKDLRILRDFFVKLYEKNPNTINEFDYPLEEVLTKDYILPRE